MVINLHGNVMLHSKGLLLVTFKASNVLNTEVCGLLDKGAIREVSPVLGQYVSSYFAVPKSERSPD